MSLNDRLRELDHRQQKSRHVSFVAAVVKKFGEDQAGQLAVNIRNDFQALLNLYEANSNALWGGQ